MIRKISLILLVLSHLFGCAENEQDLGGVAIVKQTSPIVGSEINPSGFIIISFDNDNNIENGTVVVNGQSLTLSINQAKIEYANLPLGQVANFIVSWKNTDGSTDSFNASFQVVGVVLTGEGIDKPKKITWDKDNKGMVLISSGSFEMGDSKNEPDGLMENAQPVHGVELNAFYMDITEVTVGQFKQFLLKSGYQYNGNWDNVALCSPSDDHPMVYVSWNDAIAYAEWSGKRLPTEAEWEKAARGNLKGQRYVWGDELKFANHYANFNGKQGKDVWDQTTAPVGSLSPNGYGLYDIVGNVSEWCVDSYSKDYYLDSPEKDPKGPASSPKGLRVIRGGSWLNCAYYLRVAYRSFNFPQVKNSYYGFRCVVGLP